MSVTDSQTLNTNFKRRRFLIGAIYTLGGIGVIGGAIPFVASWNSSAKARSSGAPVKVNIQKIEQGQRVTVAWRGKPVWIVHRSSEMLTLLKQESLRAKLRDPDSSVTSQQPEYVVNEYRSIKPTYLVAIGICTHLGCVPTYRPEGIDGEPEGYHGFFCPCHGSKFDMAGRVFKSHEVGPSAIQFFCFIRPFGSACR